MVNEDTHALRRDVDKLLNQLGGLEGLEENIIAIVEERLLERDHPVGSPYFTFIVSDNPNNRFPGTEWVRVEENTYLVSAGDGVNALQSIGSNTHTLNNNEIPSHAHKTMLTNNTANSGTVVDIESNWYRNLFSVANTIRSAWNTLLNIGTGGTGRVEVPTTHTGGGQAHNNMPKSIAIYMWRRIA